MTIELRQRLADRNFLALARAAAPAGVRVRTQEELDGTLHLALERHQPGQDIHIFGYGSLMWNPGVEHVATFKARVHGWHRSFCLRSVIGRGTPDTPGLMLALDRGGSCEGVLLRIAAAGMRDELSILWRREMAWGSYQSRWVTAWVGTVPFRALTFVVDHCNDRYLRGVPPEEAARLIATGCGSLGSCRAYFDATMTRLKELGIRDRSMERLDALVRAAQAA